MKTHIEEAKRLLATNFRKPHGEHLVRYLGASYDDFRKEIWVVGVLFIFCLLYRMHYVQGDFLTGPALKVLSVGDGKIPTKKVKVRVCPRENVKI